MSSPTERSAQSAAVLIVLALGAFGGCATTHAPANADGSTHDLNSQPATADAAVARGLKLLVSPEEAEILINGESHGSVRSLSEMGGVLPLKAGVYRVTLKAPGYETWRAEVSVSDGSTETIQLSMVPRK